jgi:hypothetical protein
MQCDPNNALRRATNFAIGVLLLCAIAIPADADTITVTPPGKRTLSGFETATFRSNLRSRL